MKGRSIVDNVLLMQELVKNYHKNRGHPRCAIKLDLMNDSVEWNFLFDMMSVMEFPMQFIRWVRNCVITPMFSMVINGVLEGFFPSN